MSFMPFSLRSNKLRASSKHVISSALIDLLTPSSSLVLLDISLTSSPSILVNFKSNSFQITMFLSTTTKLFSNAFKCCFNFNISISSSPISSSTCSLLFIRSLS
eukprot:NODE_9_length_47730_cov_0.323718.p33 type:complete len:104 gc:universal NODE_9_length_47730_cov_0.323718:13734-13423(-)